MKLTCITTWVTPPFSKSIAFFIEVGKSYTAIREQYFNGIKCYVLKEDKIGALYPAYMFEILN